jgi:hypothetical protein
MASLRIPTIPAARLAATIQQLSSGSALSLFNDIILNGSISF